MAKSGITAVICTYNGAARLEPTLAALAAQEAPDDLDWRVMLVDNASTDQTKQVAETWRDRTDAPFDILDETTPGKAHALNTAFAHVETPLYCIVDDDNHLCPMYLAEAAAFMDAHPHVGLCVGRIDAVFEDDAIVPANFNLRWARKLAIRDEGDQCMFNQHSIAGAGLVGRTHVMRAIYEQVGGLLDDRVGDGVGCGEDLEKASFHRLLGWETAYVPTLRLGHGITNNRLTLDYIQRLECAAEYVGPWLRLLNNRDRPRGAMWQAIASVPDACRAAKHAIKGLLPRAVNPDVNYWHGQDRHWSRFYLSRIRGRLAVARHRKRIEQILAAIASAPSEARPPGDPSQ